jgi:Tol biopolymer transport system component
MYRWTTLSAALLLAAALAAQAQNPAPPPRPIVFTAFMRWMDNEEVWRANADATQARNLTNTRTNDFLGELSKDETMVAFSGDIGGVGTTQVFIMKADGTGRTQLTKTGNNYHPSFSPDGKQLVFYSSRNNQLYLINVDGTGETPLTRNGQTNRDPVFSPDGTSVYFGSTRNGNADIYRIGIDGKNEVRLTTDPDEDKEPAVSPNGTRLAFARKGALEADKVTTQIYVMNADGTDEHVATMDAENASHPSFSPDGTQLVYQAGPFYTGSIRVVSLEGAGTRDVFGPDGPKASWSPTWGK